MQSDQMFADVNAAPGPNGSKSVQALAASSAKALIEDVPFKTMPYMVARICCDSTKENDIHKLRFEIDLAYYRTKDYKPYFLVEVRENEKVRLHFGMYEYREHAYCFRNIAGGTTHYTSSLSARPIDPKKPLKTLADFADAMLGQLNYELPSRNTPEDSMHSDAIGKNLKVLAGIAALAKSDAQKKSFKDPNANLLRAIKY
jgi:hypothetical protein